MIEKFKLKIIHLLNIFCFCKFHADDCSGCPFKNFNKCPLNTVVDKIGNSLYK